MEPQATPRIEEITDPRPERLLDLPAGTPVGRYLLLERIAEGGMGVLYLAYDPRLDRRLALKFVAAGEIGGEAHQRTLREARALAAIHHPNVLAIHDAGEFGSALWIATDLIAGESLRAWRERTRPGWRALLAAMRQALDGLSAAHAIGLVHRDFKPDNAMIDAAGHVRVIDFGLAAQEGASGASADPPVDAQALDLVWQRLTRTGARMGTPAYMPPEQWRDAAVDARADQFAWCASCVELLTGRPPFAGATPTELWSAIERGCDPRVLAGSGLPTALQRALLRGLAPDPAARHADLAPLRAALDGALGRRNRSFAAGGVLAALALAAGAVWWPRAPTDPCRIAEPRLAALDGAGVHPHFVASGLPYAAATADAVSAALSNWRDQWQDTARASCRATREGRQSQRLLDLQGACLDQRLAEAGALLRLLGSADDALIGRATQAVQGLPAPGLCAQRSALLERVAEPAAVEARAALQQLRPQLAQMQALFLAGRYAEIVAGLPAAEALATRAGHPPTSAELAFVGARALDDTNDFEAARASYVRAYAEGLAGRDPARAVLAASHLAGSLQAKAQDRAAAELWIGLARASFRSIESPSAELKLQLLLDETRVLQSRGEFAAAAPKATDALRLAESLADGRPSYLLLRALSNLGNNHIYLGEWQSARALYERLLPQAEALLGASHPRLGLLLGNAGAIHEALGDTAATLASSRRALEIALANFGEAHWESMVALYNLGERLHAAGELAEAQGLYQRALAAGVAAVGAEHPQIALLHVGLGELQRDLGAHADALQSADTALRGLAAPDADRGVRVRALLLRAELLRTAEPTEARAALAQAASDLPQVAEPDLRASLQARLESLRQALRLP
ncbi:MAG: hypothetical protein AMXMBFR25_01610 [Lysobacterales bacterium]